MTELAVRAGAAAGRRPSSQLTGTGYLLRLALRRDRVKLIIWTVAIAAFVPYFSYALTITSGDNAQQTVDQLGQAGPMIAIFAGPLYGLDAATFNRYFLMYTQEFLLAAGIMNILLITRHTRAEEQTGRAELLFSGAIGRYAQLTAALVMAVITNAVLAMLIIVGALSIGFALAGAVLFASGIAVTGLVFAAVTAVAVQFVENSRTAGGLAGAVLAASSIARGAAAVASNESPLLWLTPLAWAPLTRVLVAERWWPLLLPVAVAAGLFAIAYALTARRDVGAGLVRPRPGRVSAADWLSSPAGLAWRLQRSGLGWQAIALAVLGLAWGSLTGMMQSSLVGDFFGSGDLVASYLSWCITTMVLIVGVLVLLSANRLRQEETSGRLEAVLATAVSRRAWLGSWLAVLAGTAVVLLLTVGLSVGVGAAATTGDAGLIVMALPAAVSRLPEVLLLLAIAALLYAIRPGLVRWAWAVIGFSMIARFFGVALNWPDAVLALSISQHLPRMPLQPFEPIPVLVMTLLSFALAGAALVRFARRAV